MSKQSILYLCTGNSCRSQMAEGYTNALRGGEFAAFSGGVAPSQVDPRAVAAMAEDGVDIGGQRSKDMAEHQGRQFDYIVTLCDNARESCPVFFGPGRRVHRGFDDPPHLAVGAASEAEAMGPYRRVRDEIKAFVLGLPGSLDQGEDF